MSPNAGHTVTIVTAPCDIDVSQIYRPLSLAQLERHIVTPQPRSRRRARIDRPARRVADRTNHIIALTANASAVDVLVRNAPELAAEIAERAEELATGGWMRIGVEVDPVVSVRIVDGQVDLIVEWPDVRMMTEGPRIIVAMKTAAIPATVAVAAADRKFDSLAHIGRLHELGELRIDKVLTGDITTIVVRDDRSRPLLAP